MKRPDLKGLMPYVKDKTRKRGRPLKRPTKAEFELLYYNNSMTIYELAEHWKVKINTIYNWANHFKKGGK